MTLCHELGPELVIASGDLSNRGRPAELEEAKALLDRLPAPVARRPRQPRHPLYLAGPRHAPLGAVRGGLRHDRRRLRTENAVACGLNSARPWRHQGGRLEPARLDGGRDGPRRRPARRAPHRRLPPPSRGRAVARLAQVPAQAPRRGAARRSPPRGAELVARRPHPPEHGRRATRVRCRSTTSRSARSFSPPRPASAGRALTGSARRTGSTSIRWTARRDRGRDADLARGRFRSHALLSRVPASLGVVIVAHSMSPCDEPLVQQVEGRRGIRSSRGAMTALCRRGGPACAVQLGQQRRGRRLVAARDRLRQRARRPRPHRRPRPQPGKQRVLQPRSAGMDVEPSWSPDGSRLAIATSDAERPGLRHRDDGAEWLEP